MQGKTEELENITTAIGELVSTEVDEVENLQYTNENIGSTAFVITMTSGKRYYVQMRMLQNYYSRILRIQTKNRPETDDFLIENGELRVEN